MNKKGFTLVELLAVIAVLVILVLIALPNVLKMFNNAKQSTFETEIKEIAKTAEKQWLKDSLSGSGARIYSKCKSGTCNSLDMISSDDLEYFVHMDSNGKVDQLYVKDNSFQYGINGFVNINDISGIERVSDVTNSNKILIDNCKVMIGGKEVSLIEEGNEPETPTPTEPVTPQEPEPPVNNEITVCYFRAQYYGRFSIATKTCRDDQTILECFNASYGYKYSRKFADCNKTDTLNNCLARYGSGQKVNASTTKVLPGSEACYYSTYLTSQACLDGETEVYVYDKKKKKRLKKKLKDITYDDLILVWDFNKGEYVYANALWIQKPVVANRSITLTFSDNTTLKVVGDHRIFNLEAGMFTLASDEKETPIGMTTIKEDGKEVTLTSRVFKDEEVLAYNVITNNHINMFANGILTSQGSNNLYRIEDMKFVKEEREQFSDEDLKDIPEEYINGLMLKEWKVYDKGSKEATLDDLHDYINKLLKNRKSQ